MNELKILITGANGQLGWELQRTVPQGIEVTFASSKDMDITDESMVGKMTARIRPEIIINAAAYTAVDRAEGDVDQAFAVNRDGVANLAAVAADLGAKVIQISTDFIFDGLKSSPYGVEDAPTPTGVYGESKLAGERCLRAEGVDYAIIRTAWVYSSHGNNFVKTMLRLLADRDELGVVADQVGTPTWANGLAGAIWQVVDKGLSGVYHWTDAGVASWYDFACAIQEEALALGLLDRSIVIRPLRTEEYPTPANRPPYSVLDKSAIWTALGGTAPHWRVSLKKMLLEM